MSTSPIRICVIAPAHSRAEAPPLLEALRPVTPPDVLIDIRHIREGSPCVENRTDWQENGMAVVRLARELAEEGYDGLGWQTLTCVASRPPARWSIYPWLAVLCRRCSPPWA